MQFDQLYNMRNNFPEKSFTKCGGEGSPRRFLQKIEINHVSIDSLKCHFF